MTDTTAATPFLAAGAAAADLEGRGPLAEATGEPMQTTGRTLWADGDQEVGVWECTPGPSPWTLETNEAVYILSGRMTVTPDDGQPQEIGPGDTAVSPGAGRAAGRSTRRSASSTSCSERPSGKGARGRNPEWPMAG